nr:uncharacterized protein LOC111413238 [Onthophagus taurus]
MANSVVDDKKLKSDEEAMKPLNNDYVPLNDLNDPINSYSAHEIIHGSQDDIDHGNTTNGHDSHDPRVDIIFNRAGEGEDERPNGTSLNVTNGDFNRPFDIRSEFGGIAGSESIPDVNIYQHKKTVAQGMMDLALFSANANQLRYVVESQDHPYFYPGIILITISLLFQVAVGVGLLLNTRYNVKDKKEICIANKISNFTIVGIFLVTVINVFISAFGVASGGSPAPVPLLPRSGGEEDTTLL